jgi:hypothetical protein
MRGDNTGETSTWWIVDEYEKFPVSDSLNWILPYTLYMVHTVSIYSQYIIIETILTKNHDIQLTKLNNCPYKDDVSYILIF